MINFTKIVGSGNDFIVIDNRENILSSDLAKIAKQFCDRKNGIGADGVLLVENSDGNTDFRMRIFNADGSEAQMCGNGARCIARFTYDKKIADKTMKFSTVAGVIEGFILDDRVRVKLTKPFDLEIGISLEKEIDNISFINTGVPHVVVFVEDIDDVDVKTLGRIIRYHKRFSPNGTNVNFVQIIDEKNIKVRTYERGVEDETLSCGSGSSASAIISGLKKECSPPVTAHTRSGEQLTIFFKVDNDIIDDVYL